MAEKCSAFHRDPGCPFHGKTVNLPSAKNVSNYIDPIKEAKLAALQEVRDKMDFEPCEPDCTPERHARHRGSWETYHQNVEIIDQSIKKIKEG